VPTQAALGFAIWLKPSKPSLNLVALNRPPAVVVQSGQSVALLWLFGQWPTPLAVGGIAHAI